MGAEHLDHFFQASKDAARNRDTSQRNLVGNNSPGGTEESQCLTVTDMYVYTVFWTASFGERGHLLDRTDFAPGGQHLPICETWLCTSDPSSIAINGKGGYREGGWMGKPREERESCATVVLRE